MTGRDEFSKGFLERWSRKKIEAEREIPAKADAKDISPTGEVDASERLARNAAGDAGSAESKPGFDLTKLPSLDSITAVTDVRAFLTPGVPAELARAALRRAWAADPAIRDFKGLAENDWDFTDPNAMPGFGALPPGTDIKKMLAQIFGDSETPATDAAGADTPQAAETPDIAGQIAPPEPPPAAAASALETEPSPPAVADSEPPLEPTGIVHRDNNIALHNNTASNDSDEHNNRRRHGSALPQ